MNGYRIRPVVYLKVWDTEAECYRWEPNEYDPPLHDDDSDWGEPPPLNCAECGGLGHVGPSLVDPCPACAGDDAGDGWN